MIPILQEIGKVALRQLQAIIQGDKGNRLTLTRAIGHTFQVESAEDGHILPRVQFLQPVHFVTVRQGQARTKIAGPMTVEQSLHPSVSGSQHQIPKSLLDLVDWHSFS